MEEWKFLGDTIRIGTGPLPPGPGSELQNGRDFIFNRQGDFTDGFYYSAEGGVVKEAYHSHVVFDSLDLAHPYPYSLTRLDAGGISSARGRSIIGPVSGSYVNLADRYRIPKHPPLRERYYLGTHPSYPEDFQAEFTYEYTYDANGLIATERRRGEGDYSNRYVTKIAYEYIQVPKR